MKNIASKLSAFALGAIVMAGAHAGTISVSSIVTHAKQELIANKNFDNANALTLQSYDVTTSDGAKFLALCIDPYKFLDKSLQGTYSVGSFSGFKDNTVVQRLFSQYYDDALESNSSSLSFQLALWELYNDTGNKLISSASTGGKQSYSLAPNTTMESKKVINDASAMIAYATAGTTIEQQYTYTLFKSDSSQWLVGATAVSAVPEPSSMAMMGLGLGVMGLVARRRRAKR